MSATKTQTVTKPVDFEWTYTEEPHASRRDLIRKAHPEVTKLFGHNPRSKYWCALTVAIQVACALYCALPSTSWLQFFVIAYVIGGTCNHSLTLAIHEMSHSLFFKSQKHNMYYSFIANWPLVVPITSQFKKYHLEHHRFQGVDGMDTDIPTEFEGHFFQTPLRKLLWVFLQPFFYAVRPKLINPKGFDTYDYMNWVTQSVFIGGMVAAGGPATVLYLLFATLFGLGLHPCAGHFIAEHYTNISSTSGPHKTGQSPMVAGGKDLYPDETFSYRGPLNWVSYFVGYHVAHHDFPFVPGSRLQEIEKLAPEFYAHLPETKSWPGTMWDFITSDVCSFDRVKRTSVNGSETKKSK